ncbi:diguanylate cyclase [Povalibacter sp.]|uniref:diguanylate cyclase n=1 Tax=Povalibacter sp. TaxID=1962978 RepID=UPI002F41A1D5
MSEPTKTTIEAATSAAIWRILLVDDEPTQRLIVARLLKRAGYEVETAGNGVEAVAKLESGDFQLMITDWEMPEMDGIALCRALRKSETRSYTYTILLTARDSIENVVAGLQAGADDYLTKPVIEPELIARLNTGKRIVTLERSLRTANEENRRISITDPLTGAYNRRYLMEQLPREIDRSARYGRELSVIMCDVDHFKRINDAHGHLGGDEALRWFVTRLQKHVRSADWVARYGGEEFVVVLPETNIVNAGAAAENLRKYIADGRCSLPGADAVEVTASFGVAGWQASVQQGATLDTLIARCDAGVYASKANGRNRVTVQAMD